MLFKVAFLTYPIVIKLTMFMSIMDKLNMFKKVVFVSGLYLTTSWILDRLQILLKATFCCCLIVTKFTTMLNSMDRLQMLLNVTFCSCLIVTIFTTIFNSIMDRLLTMLKVTFCSCPIITELMTLFTSITYMKAALLK